MNRIQELIKELCPNGVELKRLGEIASISKGDKPLEIKDKGKYKYINAGTTPSGFCDHCNSDGSAVTTPSHGQGGIGYVGFQNDSFWCGALCYKLYGIENITNVRFLYHYLSQNNYLIKQLVNEGGVPYFNQNKLENVEIPLPPLPVQTEIVRILDKFVEQQEQLEKLIELRKKQYEYYREEMLTAKEGWETKTLGEICKLVTGGEPPLDCIKGEIPNDSNKYPIYGNGAEVYGFANTYRIEHDAVCISSIGANTGSIFFHKGKFTPIIRLKVLVPYDDSINSKFLYHTLQKTKIKPKAGGIPNINANDVKKIIVNIPAKSKQNEIVKTLDSFESSISALTSALELSKKRYEHYRDEMLRF